MSILINEKDGIFHLQNRQISYVMKVLRNGQLGQIYYGRRLHDCLEYDHLVELGHRDMAPCVFDGETTFSMEHLKQEYPGFGTGDMRYPAVEILCADGSRVTEFLYDHVELQAGKPELLGLPATYVEEEHEAETLKIVLKDRVKSLTLVLTYTIFRELPVITRNAWIQNEGEEKVTLEKAMSVSVDFPDCEYEMFCLSGASLRERHPQAQPLHQGVQDIHSLRGHSSHQFNPFLGCRNHQFLTDSRGFFIGKGRTMQSFWENMQFKIHTGLSQGRCQIQAVFHWNRLVFKSMPDKCFRHIFVDMMFQGHLIQFLFCRVFSNQTVKRSFMGKLTGSNHRITEDQP